MENTKDIKKDDMTKENVRLSIKVSLSTIFFNIILFIIKIIVGIVGRSSALISDAIHSASDVFSTLIVMVGVSISGKRADESHRYGHEKMESVAGLFLSFILLLTGVLIGYNAVMDIINDTEIAIPSVITLYVAVLSIIVKEAMFWYTKAAAKKVHSSALMADAWHHRSDSLSSVGSCVGILGARMGYSVLDPLAGIVICLFVVKAAIDICKDSVDKLVDRSCDVETVKKMAKIIKETDGVIDLKDIKTRLFGARIYMDIVIIVDGNLRLNESHEIATIVHNKIENNFEGVKHCMVHVNPWNEVKGEEKDKKEQ